MMDSGALISKTQAITVGIALLMLSACSSTPSSGPESSRLFMPESTTLVDRSEAIKPLTIDEQLQLLDQIRNEKPKDFTLGKGDILSISVYAEPDLSINGLPVRVDGKISYPLVGDIQAEGLTVDELKESLRVALTDYLNEPIVSVIVSNFASLKFTIAGEVAEPGTFPLVSDVTLTQAIASAGGLKKGSFHGSSVELADLTHAYVSRDGDLLPIDFVQLFRNGDLRFDVPLKPGDYVYIPSGLAQEIYILGEVTNANLFAYSEGFSITDALTQAQGFTPDADIKRIHVVRGSLSNPELYIVNMEKVLTARERDLRLKAGDIVYVPPTGLTNWSRMLTKIMPSLSALQTGILLAK